MSDKRKLDFIFDADAKELLKKLKDIGAEINSLKNLQKNYQNDIDAGNNAAIEGFETTRAMLSNLEKEQASYQKILDERVRTERTLHEYLKDTLPAYSDISNSISKVTDSITSSITTSSAYQNTIGAMGDKFEKFKEPVSIVTGAIANGASAIGGFAGKLLDSNNKAVPFINSIKGMNAAMSANPVMAVVTVLMELMNALKQNQAVADLFTQATDAVNEVIGVLIDAVADKLLPVIEGMVKGIGAVTGAMSSLLSLDFKKLVGGMNNLSASTTDVENNVMNARKALQALEGDVAAWGVEEAKLKRKIEANKKVYEDATISAEERYRAFQAAADAEADVAEKEAEFAEIKFKNETKLLGLKKATRAEQEALHKLQVDYESKMADAENKRKAATEDSVKFKKQLDKEAADKARATRDAEIERNSDLIKIQKDGYAKEIALLKQQKEKIINEYTDKGHSLADAEKMYRAQLAELQNNAYKESIEKERQRKIEHLKLEEDSLENRKQIALLEFESEKQRLQQLGITKTDILKAQNEMLAKVEADFNAEQLQQESANIEKRIELNKASVDDYVRLAELKFEQGREALQAAGLSTQEIEAQHQLALENARQQFHQKELDMEAAHAQTLMDAGQVTFANKQAIFEAEFEQRRKALEDAGRTEIEIETQKQAELAQLRSNFFAQQQQEAIDRETGAIDEELQLMQLKGDLTAEKEIELTERKRNVMLTGQDLTETQRLEIIKRADDNIAEIKKQEVEREQQTTEARINAGQSLLGAMSSIANSIGGQSAAMAKFQKVMALFQIGMDTAKAISGAIAQAQVLPFPGNIVAVATGIATVTANVVKAIQLLNKNSEPKPPKFAQGGYVDVGGRPHAHGGTKYFGEDGNAFEVERGERIYVLKTSASNHLRNLSNLNTAFGGNSWAQAPVRYAAQGGQIADGGMFLRSISNGADSSLQLQSAISEGFSKAPAPILKITELEKVTASRNRSIGVSEL